MDGQPGEGSKVFKEQPLRTEAAMCLFMFLMENQSGGVMGPAVESPNGLLQRSSA